MPRQTCRPPLHCHLNTCYGCSVGVAIPSTPATRRGMRIGALPDFDVISSLVGKRLWPVHTKRKPNRTSVSADRIDPLDTIPASPSSHLQGRLTAEQTCLLRNAQRPRSATSPVRIPPTRGQVDPAWAASRLDRKDTRRHLCRITTPVTVMPEILRTPFARVLFG